MADTKLASASLRAVPLRDLTASDIDGWRRLAASACEGNPFLEPEYLLPFSATQDSLDGMLHLVEVDGELALCALVTRERRPLGPLAYGALSTSSDFGEREMARTFPLVRKGNAVAALTAWFQCLHTMGGTSALWLRDLFADGPLATAAREAAAASGLPTVVHGHGWVPYVPAGTWGPAAIDGDGLCLSAPHLNRKAQSGLRRSVRLVKGELGEEPTWTDRAASPEAIDEFLQLQVAGWRGRGEREGIAYADSEARGSALREAASAYRDARRLVVGTLSAAGETLHMSIGFQSAMGTWVAIADAFNERFSALGVGRLGRVAWLGQLSSRAPAPAIDPCTRTRDHTVLGFFPAQRATQGILIGVGGARSRAVVRMVRAREKFA